MMFQIAAAQKRRPFDFQNTPFQFPTLSQPLTTWQPTSLPVQAPAPPVQAQNVDFWQLAFELAWRHVDAPGFTVFQLGGKLMQSTNPVVGVAGTFLSFAAFLHSLDKLSEKLDN